MIPDPLVVLSRILGEPRQVHEGEYEFRCPFCHSLKRKLGVEFRKGAWHCFRCKAGGSLRNLFLILNAPFRPGMAVPERFKFLPPSKCGGTPPEYRPLRLEDNGGLAQAIFDYFQQRGVSRERTVALGVGTSPVYPGRAVIPITMHGKTVHFIARAINPEDEPKELSPAAPDHCAPSRWQRGRWWPRRFVLFGYDEVKNRSPVDILTIVEGIFDREALHRAGYASVALLGGYMSDYQAGLIVGLDPRRIVIVPDGDRAGADMVVRSAKRLRPRTMAKIEVWPTPEGRDPDEVPIEDLRNLASSTVPIEKWVVERKGG